MKAGTDGDKLDFSAFGPLKYFLNYYQAETENGFQIDFIPEMRGGAITGMRLVVHDSYGSGGSTVYGSVLIDGLTQAGMNRDWFIFG